MLKCLGRHSLACSVGGVWGGLGPAAAGCMTTLQQKPICRTSHCNTSNFICENMRAGDICSTCQYPAAL